MTLKICMYINKFNRYRFYLLFETANRVFSLAIGDVRGHCSNLGRHEQKLRILNYLKRSTTPAPGPPLPRRRQVLTSALRATENTMLNEY